MLRQYVGERIILLVDETTLGPPLSMMVVGLAYRGCCMPLAFWCYRPDNWPMGQVALIEEPPLAARVLDERCSLFRNGLRLWDACLGQVQATLMAVTQAFFVFLDPPSLKSVGP